MLPKNSIWLCLLLLFAAIGVSCAAPEAPAPTPTTPPEPTAVPAGIWVDTTVSTGDISPLVFGTNYGPWQAITTENQPNFEASGLTFLRFPGGRWGDSNNLRDYHIRQLMTYVDQLDGDVTISARMLGGTPEQAADLVELVNNELGHDVKYWSIGNEPSLYIDLQKAEEWDIPFYLDQWGLYADAMLEVDPDILLLGPNTHQFRADETLNPKDPNGLDWMREFLSVYGDRVDVVTFHRYPYPKSASNPLPTIEEMRDNTQEWDEIIPKIREVILEETGREIPIGVMEINSNWSNAAGSETTPDGYYNAIWWGDVLTRMIQQDVFMVTHFALQNNSSGWAMLDRTGVRPTYYVYQMYQHFGETKVGFDSDERYINVLASRRASDDALTIMLINLDIEAATVPFSIDGETDFRVDEVWELSPERNAEMIGGIDLDGSIELPGQSMTLLVIQ